jgi:uncharacterized protein (DUF1778 family)
MVFEALGCWRKGTESQDDGVMTMSLQSAIVAATAEGMGTMTSASTTKPRRETLNLRIPATERYLIDCAAESAGKTRTDFILEAARRAAEETLLDRALLVVSPTAYEEFQKRLDRPAQPNERLRRTMQDKAPWRKA